MRPCDYNGHVPSEPSRGWHNWPAYRRWALITGLAVWALFGTVLALALNGVIT